MTADQIRLKIMALASNWVAAGMLQSTGQGTAAEANAQRDAFERHAEQIAAHLSCMESISKDHVVVPLEPTAEMIAAGCRQWDSTPPDQYQIDCCRETYRAMLAAAIESLGNIRHG